MASFLPNLLRQSAERHGDKAAFRFAETELSYEGLVARANRLANALRANGIGQGDLVGILMGKSLENAVAVYGILSAGAAYVPLDPSAPVASLERVVRDCNLRHFVTDDGRMSRAVKLCQRIDESCFVYGVDSTAGTGKSDEVPKLTAVGWSEIDSHSPVTPALSPGDDDLSYLIFTSGSTGTPKGIMHTHRSASAYAEMAARLYGVGPHDRLSNFPPLHFDQSTFDFFSGPLAGATTVIIGKEHQLVPASLSRLIEQERLTIWYSVPLALVQLLLYGVLDERDCSSLRWVVYGGEPFPLKHLKALMDRWPDARFSNCYGPAETNQCTFHHLEPLTDAAVAVDGGVPIGTACPGMETLVVDEGDQPVPPGQSGQLLVHSPTMMRGYWGRMQLNDHIFHHRLSADGVRRYYRTGDVARVNERGLLEFLGRADRQVKVRGFRVELDGVEAAIMTHGAVKEVAVTTSRDGADDSVALVAFVSIRPGESVDGPSLQRHASSRLARYAVPSSITIVDEFPRTTSGKIDYRALKKQGMDA